MHHSHTKISRLNTFRWKRIWLPPCRWVPKRIKNLICFPPSGDMCTLYIIHNCYSKFWCTWFWKYVIGLLFIFEIHHKWLHEVFQITLLRTIRSIYASWSRICLSCRAVFVYRMPWKVEWWMTRGALWYWRPLSTCKVDIDISIDGRLSLTHDW